MELSRTGYRQYQHESEQRWKKTTQPKLMTSVDYYSFASPLRASERARAEVVKGSPGAVDDSNPAVAGGVEIGPCGGDGGPNESPIAIELDGAVRADPSAQGVAGSARTGHLDAANRHGYRLRGERRIIERNGGGRGSGAAVDDGPRIALADAG